MSQSVAAPAPSPGGASGAGSVRGTPNAGGAKRHWGLVALVLVLLVLALAVGAVHAYHAYHAYRRLDAARGSPGVRDPADYPIQTWLPVRVVARNHRVPESVLLDALREAGFTVQPQETVPDLPGPLRGAVPPVGAGNHLLPPDRQSLRQIAWYSHRDSSEAVRVAAESIRAYRQAHPQPSGPPARPVPPAAPGSAGGRSGS